MYRQIVVGTDGSATAGTAVRTAIELARATEAELVVVSGYSPKPDGSPQADQAPADIPLGPGVYAGTVVDGAAQEAEAAGVAVTRETRAGDPADVLLSVAEERAADLIVVGNKGMAGVQRFLLGSVPDKISHHAPCSVMIVQTS